MLQNSPRAPLGARKILNQQPFADLGEINFFVRLLSVGTIKLKTIKFTLEFIYFANYTNDSDIQFEIIRVEIVSETNPFG